MEIELQFLSLSVITYSYCPLPVTISLEKIICWLLNRGKKAINNDTCNHEKVAAATLRRWPFNGQWPLTVQLLRPRPPKNFFYKLANSVRVMKQQNSHNLNFCCALIEGYLSDIINFLKTHCSDVRFSLASLQEIFLGGLG